MRMFTEEEERVIKILLQRVFHSEQQKKRRGNGHCRDVCVGRPYRDGIYTNGEIKVSSFLQGGDLMYIKREDIFPLGELFVVFTFYGQLLHKTISK